MKRDVLFGSIFAVLTVILLVLGIIQLNFSVGGLGKYANYAISRIIEANSNLSIKDDNWIETLSNSEDKANGDNSFEEVIAQLPEGINDISEYAPVVNIEKEEEPDTEEEIVEPEPERIDNPYTDYYLKNEDMVAWLYIPNTPIDYPVMYTPEDEEYYLKKGFDKKGNANGCLILDTDSSVDPLSTNLIIHGHCMNSGAMFGTLSKYEKEEYYGEHSTIYLYDKDREHRYEVIAVFRSQVFRQSDTCFKYYKFFNAETEEEFSYFYDNIKEMSVYDTGVEAEFGDKFITLSTCAYHVQNGRFVVVAKEVEGGDYYLPISFSEKTDENDNESDNMSTN